MVTQIFSRVRGCNGAFDWRLQVLNAQWEGRDWPTGLLRSVQRILDYFETLRTFSGCFCCRGLDLHQGHQVGSSWTGCWRTRPSFNCILGRGPLFEGWLLITYMNHVGDHCVHTHVIRPELKQTWNVWFCWPNSLWKQCDMEFFCCTAVLLACYDKQMSLCLLVWHVHV